MQPDTGGPRRITMATVGSIEMNYFGLTLYVTPRGRDTALACQAVNWQDAPEGKLRVFAKTWPGYGKYQGWVTLTAKEREVFYQVLGIKV